MMVGRVSILLDRCLLHRRSLTLLSVMKMMKTDQVAEGLCHDTTLFHLFIYLPNGVIDCCYCLPSYRGEREYKVVIKLAARADLHHLDLFLQGRRADAPQEVLQVLDIVLRESPSTRYLLFASHDAISSLMSITNHGVWN